MANRSPYDFPSLVRRAVRAAARNISRAARHAGNTRINMRVPLGEIEDGKTLGTTKAET